VLSQLQHVQGASARLCVCFAGLTTGDAGWGSPTFAKMGRKKIQLISLFLKLDVQVAGWT
jgi:hypothetical protein